MIPELGNLALILALLLATILGTLPIIGAQRGIRSWVLLARPIAKGQFLFCATAWFCLMYSFVTSDFSVLNVATNSNSQLPLPYRFAATWGSHEGSMLLWVFMLSIWTLAVSVKSRNLPDDMVARVLGVMGLVSVGFLLFTLLTSNPFDRLFPVPADGHDLNPLLQDPGMVAHPPMLYTGYVGFSVAFAFAIAALISGRLDTTWARWSRPWTTCAWSFLTIGIMIGSWWAYYTLGWGGWWFWDPVENASFMPWLVGTALLHSLAVTEKRATFKNWTVLLAICAFSLSLVGTFLVRSGVLTSVHAFATDPRRGVFILAFLIVVIGGSLTLYAIRAPRVGIGGRFALASRESALLGNNVLLVAAGGSVLLGTLYPLFLDALNLGKISVGPPYFDTVFVPLMTPVAFLMGVGPLAKWKETSIPDLWLRLRWALGVSVVTALLLPFLTPEWKPGVAFGLLLALWVVTSTLTGVRERLGGLRTSVFAQVRRQPRSYWGMVLAHLGIATCIVGITMVKGYETERDVKLNVGDTVTVAGYVFRFDGVSDRKGPNYQASRGVVTVSRNGKFVETLTPEKRAYNAGGMPMTNAAIDTGPFGDIYVSMGEPVDGGAWVIRVYSKPFIIWVWFGFLMMATGGFLALSDRRYRVTTTREVSVPRAVAAAWVGDPR